MRRKTLHRELSLNEVMAGKRERERESSSSHMSYNRL